MSETFLVSVRNCSDYAEDAQAAELSKRIGNAGRADNGSGRNVCTGRAFGKARACGVLPLK
jgi:hypothetical protein